MRSEGNVISESTARIRLERLKRKFAHDLQFLSDMDFGPGENMRRPIEIPTHMRSADNHLLHISTEHLLSKIDCAITCSTSKGIPRPQLQRGKEEEKSDMRDEKEKKKDSSNKTQKIAAVDSIKEEQKANMKIKEEKEKKTEEDSHPPGKRPRRCRK